MLIRLGYEKDGRKKRFVKKYTLARYLGCSYQRSVSFEVVFVHWRSFGALIKLGDFHSGVVLWFAYIIRYFANIILIKVGWRIWIVQFLSMWIVPRGLSLDAQGLVRNKFSIGKEVVYVALYRGSY